MKLNGNKRMQEYRTSLSSQAVTEKTDVKEWKPSKKEKANEPETKK
ncbi:MAG: hypothetical protein PHT79_10670 [Syntrophomonadaceae bacterium]|nr:hypothetical protein [Syntrophomonadaceae bacterium]